MNVNINKEYNFRMQQIKKVVAYLHTIHKQLNPDSGAVLSLTRLESIT